MKNRHYAVFCLAAALIILGYTAYENNTLSISRYTYESEKLPPEFAGFKIAHISDLHNKRFGNEKSRLISLIKKEKPDIIVISGDLLDSRHPDKKAALEFVRLAADIAPVYYVTGNHERRMNDENLDLFLSELENAGAVLLDSRTEAIERNGEKIYISGIFDSFDNMYGPSKEYLKKLCKDGEINLLISHKPQYAEIYTDCGFDLTFCGHAHGGQARLPFIGGVLAPDQGLFPKYSEGTHYFGDKAVVISRGLGNSLVPIRINNPPELVTVTLEVKDVLSE